MENFQVYRDIQARTGGDIYIGVVGPVRTGKSTFIRRFMETAALPGIREEKQDELRDALPVSGSGKMITTVEPKFIPKEAVPVLLGGEQKVRIKLIDCVGFLVKDAAGHVEDGKERMVKTPWSAKEIPFHEAAQIGTEKVISQHSTIGIVMTTDGSFGEIPRENFIPAEERTIEALKKQEKPFIVVVNSQIPYKEETQQLVKEIQEKYKVSAMAVNCEQLRKEDVLQSDLTLKFTDLVTNFGLGKIGMMPFAADWVKDAVSQGMDPDDLGLMLPPAGPSGERTTAIAGTTYVINAKADQAKKDAAWEYIAHKAGVEYQKAYYENLATKGAPNPMIIPRDDMTITDFYEFPEEYSEVLEQAKTIGRLEFYGKADFGTYVDRAVQKILVDPNADPEKEFADAQKQCEDEVLDSFNETNKK